MQQLHGIGPSGAARLLGDIGDISRFANRDHFASAEVHNMPLLKDPNPKGRQHQPE